MEHIFFMCSDPGEAAVLAEVEGIRVGAELEGVGPVAAGVRVVAELAVAAKEPEGQVVGGAPAAQRAPAVDL